MKPARQTYMIVTAMVACSLLAGGLAEGKDSGIGAGIRLWDGAFRVIACCVGAMGVIWLGWYWLRLAGTITSIATWLKQGQYVDRKPQSHGLMDELTQAIDDRAKADSEAIGQLKAKVRDLHLQLRLAQRQRSNTEAIIYSLRDAVIVIDEFDRLLMANEAAARLFDFDCRTAQHQRFEDLVDASKHEFIERLRQSRQSRARAARCQMELTQEGQTKAFDCVISCVYDQCQKVCGAAAVLHDVTREKEISQMKNDFVSHVSHELKTPLASITAYSEMLADGEADDEQTRKQFYAVIQNQAQRLNHLIEDILNISRIESGLIKVEKKPVSLAILIDEQLQMIEAYAEEKQIKIIAQKPIVYDQVYADKEMISQVIVNLLSNAVKYTPKGGSVTVETVVDETAGTAQVTVTDTGVGIPPGEIEHIFDKFYRVDANKKQAKGTGLGLNLVRQIVETVHGGRVFVTSEPGVGSTFGFELPLATPEMVGAA